MTTDGENKVPNQQRHLAGSRSAYHYGRPPPAWDRYYENDHWSSRAASLLSFSLGRALKGAFAVTVALYILNQQHLLPKPLSAVVSKVLFWPTLPITISRRLGAWSTVVDDTVLIGGAPFGFANYPERLYRDYGVRGVINLCEEYSGPSRKYKKLGMNHLRLPTVDHFQSSVEDLETAVSFIQKHRERGGKVYVHCRAGHGRSAAVVMAWLLYNDPKTDRKTLNEEFCRIRNVRKTLWRQDNIMDFHEKLLSGEIELPELASHSPFRDRKTIDENTNDL